MPTYAQNKASIYKWRDQNREAYNECQKSLCKVYYERNKEILSARKKRDYYNKKPSSKPFLEEVERLSNIMLF